MVRILRTGSQQVSEWTMETQWLHRGGASPEDNTSWASKKKALLSELFTALSELSSVVFSNIRATLETKITISKSYLWIFVLQNGSGSTEKTKP